MYIYMYIYIYTYADVIETWFIETKLFIEMETYMVMSIGYPGFKKHNRG